MDIVIGYQGKDHVKAEQLRRLIAGMAGDGTYVLGTQNELAATMVTANQVRIDTGDIVAAGGAYATVETPETLTVESGATGQKRHDLVVARYEKDASTSVESMELAVVKGTAVSFGDPVDPEVQDGSIIDGDSPVEVPLWRIPIDGLAPGTPVALFETIPTIDSLRDSVSQLVEVPFEQPSTIANTTVSTEVDLPVIEGLIPVAVANVTIRRPSTDVASAYISVNHDKAYVCIWSPYNVTNTGVSGSILVAYRPS